MVFPRSYIAFEDDVSFVWEINNESKAYIVHKHDIRHKKGEMVYEKENSMDN